jgi:hypothetical protein
LPQNILDFVLTYVAAVFQHTVVAINPHKLLAAGLDPLFIAP